MNVKKLKNNIAKFKIKPLHRNKTEIVVFIKVFMVTLSDFKVLNVLKVSKVAIRNKAPLSGKMPARKEPLLDQKSFTLLSI